MDIGTDPDNQNINLGTSGDRTIAIGRLTGATGVVIDAGSGGVSIDAEALSNFSTTAGNLSLSSAATTDIDGATGITLDAAANDIDINSAAANVDIDGVGVQIDGTTAGVRLDASGGAIDIGTIADNQNINTGTLGDRTMSIGALSGATGVAIDGGSSGISIDGEGASNFTVDGANLTLSTIITGNVEVNSVGNVNINGTNTQVVSGDFQLN